MKKSYASSRAVPVWFDDTTVMRLNRMAIRLEMPRNRIVRRMLELMLIDIDVSPIRNSSSGFFRVRTTRRLSRCQSNAMWKEYRAVARRFR